MPAQIGQPTLDRIKDLAFGAVDHKDIAAAEVAAWQLTEAMGFNTPNRVFLGKDPADLEEQLDRLKTQSVVVKAIARGLVHRSQLGGVAFVARRADSVRDTMRRMEIAIEDVGGFAIFEHIAHGDDFGQEFLFSLRWTHDFGPVSIVATGGSRAELFARNLHPRARMAAFSAYDTECEKRLESLAVIQAAPATQSRTIAAICDSLRKSFEAASHLMPHQISEIEFNPIIVNATGVTALDVVVKPPGPTCDPCPDRPIEAIQAILNPRTIAIAGVSSKRNPGRIILENLVQAFPAKSISIIKPGCQRVLDCECVESVAALRDPVDLAVLAIPGRDAVLAASQLVERQLARGILIIPGGLEETDGEADHLRRLREAISDARQRADGGPVINGGNCVGVRSVPGGLNTLFIPQDKLPPMTDCAEDFAVISQSGAFLVSLLDRLDPRAPRYAISVGNQTDLTIADYLAYFHQFDPDLETIAIYTEGLAVGDGIRLARLAREMSRHGTRIVLYRAGRTVAGRQASATHTAAIAGDIDVMNDILRQSGITVAERIDEVEDQIKLSCAFKGKSLAGNHLAAITNAGFECVAIADHLGPFRFAELSVATQSKLHETFNAAGISAIVNVGNPADVTPMMNDQGYGSAIESLLNADEVDALVVGCVPLTPALQTLPQGRLQNEDLGHQQAFASILSNLVLCSEKPVVVAVDGGARYRPLRDYLTNSGVAVFERIDRAMDALASYASHAMSEADYKKH